MAEATAVKTNETTRQEVMNDLYRSLAVVQANITLYLRKSTNEEDLKRRALEITQKLETIANEYAEPSGGKCGATWAPTGSPSDSTNAQT